MNGIKRGFTIVELLIVIVVMGILAAVSMVAYSNISARTRDSQRMADARSIIQAIKSYRALNNDAFPPTSDTKASSCAPHTNGYSFSTATDGSWLASLVASGSADMGAAPVPPGNGCRSYYSYLAILGDAYNCPSRTRPYAIFQVFGAEGSSRPSGALTSRWQPCVGSTATWGPLDSSDTSTWTFILE